MDNLSKVDHVKIIRAACILRWKYRIRPDLICIYNVFIVPHPATRGGLGLSHLRCKLLAEGLLNVGFEPNEADCNDVNVQEHPGTRAYQDHCNNKFEGNPMLAPSVEGSVATHASLSQSHLNQVFKNFFCL